MAAVSRMHFHGISGNVNSGWARSRWEAPGADKPCASPVLAACGLVRFSPMESAIYDWKTLETIVDGHATYMGVCRIWLSSE